MTRSCTRLLAGAAVSSLLGLAAAPSLAGNYAEGDPRPVPFSSSTSRAAVSAEARQWLATAPTQGYTEGSPQPGPRVSANSRAAVAADTQLWLRSGLAAQQNGEAGADPASPAYRQAAADYARLRTSSAYGALIDGFNSRQSSTRAEEDGNPLR